MSEVEIKLLESLNIGTWHRIVSGYSSTEKYAVNYSESAGETSFSLYLTRLDTPYIKQFEQLSESDITEHNEVLKANFSFGAYDEDELVGLAIALPQQWNNTLWLQEFHVAKSHQGRGIGQALMQRLIEKADTAGFRLIYLETQNTNVPAIGFYRRMGFTIESVDLSFYSNADYPDGEIAIFMKHRLSKS